MVTDANAVAQETALGAILEYVSNAPNATKYIHIYILCTKYRF